MHIVYAAAVVGVVVLVYADKHPALFLVWGIVAAGAMLIANRWDKRNPW